MLEHDDIAVLRAALRTRHTDAEQLSRTLRRRRGEVESALRRLEADGFLVNAQDHRVPRPPHEPVLAEAAAKLRAQALDLESLGRSIGELPALMRDWEWGEPNDERTVSAEFVHGPSAMVDAWWRYADQTRPVSTVCVAPDAGAFSLVPSEDLQRLAEITQRSGGIIRIIVASDSVDASTAAVIGELERTGLVFRTIPDPPSWFFADQETVVALPAHWGDPWPTSILLVRQPVFAEALRSYFESLWARAQPITGGREPWEPILKLLDQGLTDDDVADELGLSTRTVRRRISEAMDELGATNRFTLGRTWARGS